MIELLVVISIIGVLTVIGVASFSGAQKKGRDAARKSELNALSKALVMYYSDKGVFPKDSTEFPGFGENFSDGDYVYMKKTPVETRSGLPGFCYAVGADLKSFGLFATLENVDDSEYYDTVPTGYSVTGCSAKEYHYAIVSPNVTASDVGPSGKVNQDDP